MEKVTVAIHYSAMTLMPTTRLSEFKEHILGRITSENLILSLDVKNNDYLRSLENKIAAAIDLEISLLMMSMDHVDGRVNRPKCLAITFRRRVYPEVAQLGRMQRSTFEIAHSLRSQVNSG